MWGEARWHAMMVPKLQQTTQTNHHQLQQQQQQQKPTPPTNATRNDIPKPGEGGEDMVQARWRAVPNDDDSRRGGGPLADITAGDGLGNEVTNKQKQPIKKTTTQRQTTLVLGATTIGAVQPPPEPTEQDKRRAERSNAWAASETAPQPKKAKGASSERAKDGSTAKKTKDVTAAAAAMETTPSRLRVIPLKSEDDVNRLHAASRANNVAIALAVSDDSTLVVYVEPPPSDPSDSSVVQGTLAMSIPFAAGDGDGDSSTQALKRFASWLNGLLCNPKAPTVVVFGLQNVLRACVSANRPAVWRRYFLPSKLFKGVDASRERFTDPQMLAWLMDPARVEKGRYATAELAYSLPALIADLAPAVARVDAQALEQLGRTKRKRNPLAADLDTTHLAARAARLAVRVARVLARQTPPALRDALAREVSAAAAAAVRAEEGVAGDLSHLDAMRSNVEASTRTSDAAVRRSLVGMGGGESQANLSGETAAAPLSLQPNDVHPYLNKPPEQALPEEAKIALQDTRVVRDIDATRHAVELLKRHARENEQHAHAIDTEVQSIDVEADAPCGHGRVICISVYAGPLVDFANNKIYSRLSDVPSDARRTLWIDTGVVLTKEQQATMTSFSKYPSIVENQDLYKANDVMEVFREYLEDDVSQKVWHNYGFDRHVLENVMLANGKTVKLAGFHGDTMHMARLFDTSRRAGAAAAAAAAPVAEDGEESAACTSYSLESLSTDRNIFSHYDAENDLEVIGRTGNEGAEDRERARELLSAAFAKRRSMKEIFSKKKMKKDGTEGKASVMPEMEELQTSEETKHLWVAYSATDAKATWMLYRALRWNLRSVCARVDKALYPSEEGRDDSSRRTLWNVYCDFLRPFGELLTDLESVGVWVDRDALKKGEETAQQAEIDCNQTFVDWASTYVENAKYINPGSVIQLRQLFYAGLVDLKTGKEIVPKSRTFKAENTENMILPGAKKPKEYLDFDLTALLPGKRMTVYGTTPSGQPQVNGPMLRKLAGNPGAGKAYLDALDAGESSPATNDLGDAFSAFGGGREGARACHAIDKMCEATAIQTQVDTFLQPLQKPTHDERIHCSLNLNTETGRLSSRRPNMQNLPALEKDLFGVRKAIRAEHGKALVVADYSQLELRLLAHLSQCQSMLHAFELGGDFHSRTALGMYNHIREAVSKHEVLLDYSKLDDSIPHDERPPLIKDVYASERRRAKVLNFSIAYGKTEYGLSKDFGVSVEDAKDTVDRWYADRPEVLAWQKKQRRMAIQSGYVATMLGRRRNLPNAAGRASGGFGGRHVYDAKQNAALRAAINSPIQGSAADVAMCAMIRIHRSEELRRLGWKLLLQVHDEMILEGPESSSEEALELTRQLMESPFDGLVEADHPALSVVLSVDAKAALTWFDAK
ncbi:DNA polymerase I [Pseudoscourfieldia marina]